MTFITTTFLNLNPNFCFHMDHTHTHTCGNLLNYILNTFISKDVEHKI